MKNIDVFKEKGTTIMFLKTEKYPLSKENKYLWTDMCRRVDCADTPIIQYSLYFKYGEHELMHGSQKII